MDAQDTADGPREGAAALAPGTLIRRVAFGSEATYRVVGENHRGVEVEVVKAPGLQPRTRFTFTVAHVVEMADREERERATHASRTAVREGVPKRRYA